MRLLIDIGNTSLKWALLHGDLPGAMTSARHFGALPIDVLASWERLEGITDVLVASVGPETVLDAIATTVAAYWQCPLTRIRTSARAQGVRVAYAQPDRLGVDRFLALIAAHWLAERPERLTPVAERRRDNGDRPITAESSPSPSRSPRPRPSSEPEPWQAPEPGRATLIIDAGTAITFDALLADGRHLGGQILPGIAMLRESLLQGTRLPPHQALDHPDPWGIDTGPAISAASLQAPAALAERLHRTLHQETGKTPRLLITGGDADRLAPLMSIEARVQPDLVLIGLARFA